VSLSIFSSLISNESNGISTFQSNNVN
jgi:hypothetical protein